MTGRLFAAVIAAALLIPAQSRAAPAPSDEAIHAVMAAVVDDVIVPGYAAFHESAEALDHAADRLCADASPQSLDAARAAFSGTVSAWGRIEMIQFGPAMDENRLERVLFYPDPRGIGLRQVQEILATEDETATKTETLAHKSVAAQGLGALEYVLFGTGSDALAKAGDPFRCRYAAAIAANLEAIGGELEEAWADPQGVAAEWKNPGGDGSAFHSASEALNDVLGALMHGIESVNDVRIAAFFADTPSKDKPKQALFWRSGNTMPLLVADIEGMRTLFDKGRMASVLPEDEKALAPLVDHGFSAAIEQAKAIDEPLVDTLGDIPNRQKFVELTGIVANLKNRLGNEYGPAIGLSTGFSFADGD